MIGYSEDGNYFAFEQFGIQDGSGFAFSDVFVIDLVNDKWTAGSPFEVEAEDEAAFTGRGSARSAEHGAGRVRPAQDRRAGADPVADRRGRGDRDGQARPLVDAGLLRRRRQHRPMRNR